MLNLARQNPIRYGRLEFSSVSCSERDASREWAYADEYRNPGPIQFQGSTRWSVPYTLQMQQGDYLNDVEQVFENLSEIESLVRPGIASPQQIAVTLAQTRAILETLRSVSFYGS